MLSTLTDKLIDQIPGLIALENVIGVIVLLVFGGIIYIAKKYIEIKGKSDDQANKTIAEIVKEQQSQNNELVNRHQDSINNLSLAVQAFSSDQALSRASIEKLAKTVDELMNKKLSTRLHDSEACISNLCERTWRLEAVTLGIKEDDGSAVKIIAGNRNFDGYQKGRERNK